MIPSAKQHSNGPATATSVPRKPGIQASAHQIDAVGVIGMVAISALVYGLGINPLLERHALSIHQQQEMTRIREKANESQKILTDLQKQSTAAARQLEASPLRLQPVTLLNQRLALVTDLAMQGGATLDDLQPGKSSAGSRFDALPIHVAGTGSFPAFTALMHRLHMEFPDTGVSTFEMSGTPQEDPTKAKFSVELLWYTEPLKRAASRGKGTSGPNDKPGEITNDDGGKGSAK